MQTGIIPKFVLFLDCPVEELKRRVLARNQVRQMHPSILHFCFRWPFFFSFLFYSIPWFLSYVWTMKGREDDNLNTILKRLKVFNEYTKPVIDHYSSIGKVHEVIYCFIELCSEYNYIYDFTLFLWKCYYLLPWKPQNPI